MSHEGDGPHRVQVRLESGVVLEARTRGGLDLGRARLIAGRVRRALRLPMWSPRWGRYPAAYRRLAEDVRRWHSPVARATVEVVREGAGEGAEHGWVPVLILPVAMPAGEVVSDDWLWAEVWDRR